jgi:TraM recognition site of TraD and TraG
MAQRRLCETCQHRYLPVPPRPPERVDSPAAKEAAARMLEELMFKNEQERDLAQGFGSVIVDAEPRFQPWCRARSTQGDFFLCAWLDGPCDQHVSLAPIAEGERNGVTAPTSPIFERNALPVERLELGARLALERRRVVEVRKDRGDRPIIHYSYELAPEPNGPIVSIDGKGLFQSYLIFGGPGAGKTHLFKRLLSQALSICAPQRVGGLILDPKGLLVDTVRELVENIGRTQDLSVVDGWNLDRGPNVNLLGYSALEPRDLGRLVADVALSEAGDLPDGWQVHVNDLIESAVVLIHAQQGMVTPAVLARDLLTRNDQGVAPIAERADRLFDDTREDVVDAVRRIQDYYTNTEPGQRRFVRQIIQRSLGEMKDSKWAGISDSSAIANIYEETIRDGKILLLSVGQGSPAFQRSLCTLVKALFQQAVLAHGSETLRRTPDRKPNPTLLACDEYAQVATESASGLVSDSRFFSLSREYRCMSLLALQSVATGKSRFPGYLRDRWEAILGNVGAKIFMRLNDVETAELASDLVGQREAEVPLNSQSSGTSKTMTHSSTLTERVILPPWLLTQTLVTGQGVAIGTLDGGSSVGTQFFAVPGEQEVAA